MDHDHSYTANLKSFSCNVCLSKKWFASNSGFKYHMKQKHNIDFPRKYNRLDRIFGCQYCTKTFATKYTLRKHSKNKHNIDTPVQKPNSLNILCKVCMKTFAGKRSLKVHMKGIHNMKEESSKLRLVKCVDCQLHLSSHQLYIKHLASEHGVNITVDKLQFDSLSDFQTWKELEHRRSNSYFHMTSGKKFGTSYSVCNRNIYTYVKNKSKKRMETDLNSDEPNLSSNKKTRLRRKFPGIDGYCPARIVWKKCNNDKLEVIYYKDHRGHDNLRNLTEDNSISIDSNIESNNCGDFPTFESNLSISSNDLNDIPIDLNEKWSFNSHEIKEEESNSNDNQSIVSDQNDEFDESESMDNQSIVSGQNDEFEESESMDNQSIVSDQNDEFEESESMDNQSIVSEQNDEFDETIKVLRNLEEIIKNSKRTENIRKVRELLNAATRVASE